MRTTLNIDDKVLSDVMLVTGKKNRSEAIRMALQEYLKQQQKKKLLAMRGTVNIDDNWVELRDLEKME